MSIISRAYGVQQTPALDALEKKSEVGPAEGFSKILSDAKDLDKDATNQAERFAAHDPSVGIHEVVIASEKASIAVRYAVTLKNKALEAYHELMNTQV